MLFSLAPLPQTNLAQLNKPGVIGSCRHSSWGHKVTQASPPHQGTALGEGRTVLPFKLMVCNRERMFTRHLQSSHIVWWSVNNCSIFASLMICRNHRQTQEINKNIIKSFSFLSHFVLFGSLVLKLQGTVTETVTYKISTNNIH